MTCCDSSFDLTLGYAASYRMTSLIAVLPCVCTCVSAGDVPLVELGPDDNG